MFEAYVLLWASVHLVSSPTLGMWPGEAFYLRDPCELTFNTDHLSNAAISLGNAVTNNDTSSENSILFIGFPSRGPGSGC